VKTALRARLLAARRAVPATVRQEEARALAGWLAGLSGLAGRSGLSGSVCAYVPVGAEPGSMAMLDALVTAGCSVLLPVVVEAGPLDWARYESSERLAPARFGLLEPSGPRLGPEAVGAATTVLVPALAVDRLGVRLGRGAGYYDRTLALASADASLVAVVRDDELVDALPREPHDVLMTAALTPTAGYTPLPP
jgi:5-formyltetrahydrofolate cyclo-ligase